MIYVNLIILEKNIPSLGESINGQLEEEKERWRERERKSRVGGGKSKSDVVANLK